jgi:serine/threonine protein kinase
MSTAPALKEGWLRKPSGLFKSWKPHYFVLRDKTLSYSRKPHTKALREISLIAVRVVMSAPECRQQPAFKVSIPNVRTFYFVASSADDASAWIAALEGARLNKGAPPPPQAPPPKRTGIEDFEIIRLIGRGTYGAVQLVRHRESRRLFAMKTMNKQMLADYQQIDQTLTERNVLLQTVHPFLVGAHYTFQTDVAIFLVLDYVPGGELFGRLKAEHAFAEPRARLYAAEILLGLGHLHSLGFVYRDLKPENILVDAEGHLKLTDFGLVKTIGGEKGTTTTFCGTPEYLAPEMLRQLPYTKAVDWWSFGCIVYEMLVGLPPFYDENKNKMYRAIMQDEVRFPPAVSADAKDLILGLLERNPNSRLGGGEGDYKEIQPHPFFAPLDWNAVMNRTMTPVWVPQLAAETDVSNFDAQFTNETVNTVWADQQGIVQASTQSAFDGFTSVNSSRL